MTHRLIAVAALALCLHALPIHAESGRLNASVDLGVAAPLSGRYGTAIGASYMAQSLGPHLTLGLDYQLLRPLAVEVIGELWGQFVPSWLSIRNLEKLPPVVVGGGLGVGPRLRLLDTEKGNLWASVHLGFRAFDGVALAIDAGAGYQFALSRLFALGPFVRGAFLPPAASSRRGSTWLVEVGVGGSYELMPFVVAPPPPADDDGDGLTNETELQQIYTDPTKADTDGDGLADGVEVSAKTNPLQADTDGDGVLDGVELSRGTAPLKADSDGDGIADGAELAARTDPLKSDTDSDALADGDEAAKQTDPLKPDTDGDGLEDGLEVATRTEPLKQDTDGDGTSDGEEDTNKNGVVDDGETDPRVAPPPDTDGDGIPDPSDNCPTVAGPTDNRGCPKETKQLVVITKEKLEILEKVYFNTRDASVLPKSFPLLDQVAAVMRNHPELKRVRIEGHTDNLGDDEKNLTLSQRRADAVFKYLSTKVDPSRLEAVGFGETRPAETNDTPAGREKNRRVEFHIAGE
jgi:outer membrane protein OmpA-like peptidoglycan-associated protein